LRESWQKYFMKMAYQVATRATCDRKHVGAVIVQPHCNRVLATGYNGAPRGAAHCDDVGHLLKEINGRMSCVRTLHAESNAIDQAPFRDCDGAHIYTTAYPCYECAKRIVNAGISKVYYGEFYASRNTEEVVALFEEAGVQCEEVKCT
jgi:dCMP deaminase